MPLFRIISAALLLLGWFLPAKAQAELRLEAWKSYGQLAEQGAICASFSALMESQSVLNPDLGALWQERRKFSGAVIRKAVMLELQRDSTEQEINQLIASYRDWVLSSLMIDGYDETETLSGQTEGAASAEVFGAKKIRVLVNNQCKSLFEQGDEMIRQQKPELAYLLEDTSSPSVNKQPSASETGPRRTHSPAPAPLVTAKAAAPDTPVNTPDLSISEQEDTEATALPLAKEQAQGQPKPEAEQQSKEVKLSIGGGNSFTLTLPGQKQVKKAASSTTKKAGSSPQIEKTTTPKLAETSGPASRPERPPQTKAMAPSAAQTPADQKSSEKSEATDTASTDLIPMRPKQTSDVADVSVAPATLSTSESGQQRSAHVLHLLDQQANAHVNLATPLEPTNNSDASSKANYFAQLGAFSRLENATAEKQRLEQKFSTLFEKLPLEITEVTNAGPRFYRIRTPELNQRQTKTVCDLLWPHRIACLVKSAKSP